MKTCFFWGNFFFSRHLGGKKFVFEQLKSEIAAAQAAGQEYSNTAVVLHEINNRIKVLENVYFVISLLSCSEQIFHNKRIFFTVLCDVFLSSSSSRFAEPVQKSLLI